MDPTVVAALAKWPDVPAVYGWLGLTARGEWRLQGQPIGNAALREFIGRNYAGDERGRWYFQNGPQRVFVTLEAAPWVWQVAQDAGTACAAVTHRSARQSAPWRVARRVWTSLPYDRPRFRPARLTRQRTLPRCIAARWTGGIAARGPGGRVARCRAECHGSRRTAGPCRAGAAGSPACGSNAGPIRFRALASARLKHQRTAGVAAAPVRLNRTPATRRRGSCAASGWLSCTADEPCARGRCTSWSRRRRGRPRGSRTGSASSCPGKC